MLSPAPISQLKPRITYSPIPWTLIYTHATFLSFSRFPALWISPRIWTSLLICCDKVSVKTELRHVEIFSVYLSLDDTVASQLYHRQMHFRFPFSSIIQRTPSSSTSLYKSPLEGLRKTYSTSIAFGRTVHLSFSPFIIFPHWEQLRWYVIVRVPWGCFAAKFLTFPLLTIHLHIHRSHKAAKSRNWKIQRLV